LLLLFYSKFKILMTCILYEITCASNLHLAGEFKCRFIKIMFFVFLQSFQKLELVIKILLENSPRIFDTSVAPVDLVSLIIQRDC